MSTEWIDDLGALASPRHGEGAARTRLVDSARVARAARVVNEVVAWSRGSLPRSLLDVLASLPGRAARDGRDVDRALSRLAGAELREDTLVPAVVRAAVASNGTLPFEAELPKPLRFRWDGVITAPATAVRYDGKRLFVFRAGAWTDDHSLAAPSARFGSRTLDLVPPWALDTISLATDDMPLSPLETDTIVAQIEDAAVFLAKATPSYFAWVDAVAAELLPLDGRDGHLRSRSQPHTPGCLGASFPTNGIALAELLVHEASHSYFDLARQFGKVEDGSDPQRYWSPVKNEGRPIDRILLTFHAWGNIDDLYGACIEGGHDIEGYAERNRVRIREDMRALYAAIEGSPAVTEMGRALCEPFAAIARA